MNGTGPGEFRDALESVMQAAKCECLSQTYNPPYRDASDLPYFEGHAASNLWDFRVDRNQANYQASVVNFSYPSPDPDIFTDTSHLLDIPAGLIHAQFVPPGYSLYKNGWGSGVGARAEPHYSSAVRRVRVHYTRRPLDAAQLDQAEVSGFIRCDEAWRGYHGRCLEPWGASGPAQDERDAILQFLQNNPSTPNSLRTNPDLMDNYARYCRLQCADERSFEYDPNHWYVQSGIAWVRTAITGAGLVSGQPSNVPPQCGGRITTWVPSP